MCCVAGVLIVRGQSVGFSTLHHSYECDVYVLTLCRAMSARFRYWSRQGALLSDPNISEPRDGFSVVKAARAANPLCVAILLTGYPDFDSEMKSEQRS